jgi:transcription elongation factor Elf1
MTREINCPFCKERMVEGYLLDLGHSNRARAVQWVEGPPLKSFWRGLVTDERRKHTVKSFRCPRCGLLLEYAL